MPVRAIYQCSYYDSDAKVSDCAELFSLAEVHADAEPRGLATDTSDHVWVAVSGAGEAGAVLELDPATATVISTFGGMIPGAAVTLPFTNLSPLQMWTVTRTWWIWLLPARTWTSSM